MRGDYMRSMAIAILCGASALLPQPALAADPVTLDPSSQWLVDFAPERCTIARQFGSGEDHTALKLSTVGPGRGFDLTLIGRHARIGRPEKGVYGHIALSFAASGPDAEASVVVGKMGRDPAFVAQGLVEIAADGSAVSDDYLKAEPERFAMIDRIEFTDGLSGKVTLKTGKMYAVFSMLERCEWQLVEEWGLDADANRNRMSAPTLPHDDYVRLATRVQARYPAAALHARKVATLQLRMIVGEDGRVRDCAILSNTTTDEFDDRPCEIFREDAVYEPARGADGAPIASWVVQVIRYNIP